MHYMRNTWRTYFFIIAGFSFCMNLIYLCLPLYMMIVYDRVLFSFSRVSLFALGVGLLICLGFVAALDYLKSRLLSVTATSLTRELEPAILRRSSYIGSNSLYTRGLADLDCVRKALTHGYFSSLVEVPWMVLYLIFLLFIHPLVGNVAIGGVFISGVFQILLYKLDKKKYLVADGAENLSHDTNGLYSAHDDIVSGLGMEEILAENQGGRREKVRRMIDSALNAHLRIGTIVRVLHMISVAAVFGAGAFAFFANEVSAGAIFAATMIVVRIFFVMDGVLSGMQWKIEAAGAYKRLDTFVSTEEQKSPLPLPEPEGHFQAEGLVFAHGQKMVLQGISFDLLPGESLGIAGPSFSGKSTICKLLSGAVPPSSGKIRLDKAELVQWPKEQLTEYMGFSPQYPVLFPGSISQNIARFQEIDPAQVVEAAKMAGAHEMILKLPQGYDTLVERTGSNLSAGQCRLISLARAFYGKPRVVILDEPHGYLDDQHSRGLLLVMQRVKEEKMTLVLVTDRSDLLGYMDKTMVIKEGKPALYGPTRDVLASLAQKQVPAKAVNEETGAE